MVFGYLLARIVISTLFLPAYFRGEMFTAYELMRIRFGDHIRKLTAGTFLLLRTLAEGVRVFAISIVISIVLGTGELASILVIVCLTLFYTFEGGMTAVIWTDVVQMFLYVTGAILSFHRHPPPDSRRLAACGAVAAPTASSRCSTSVSPDPAFFAAAYSFWAGIIGGCFLTTASHGTEQFMVQRLLWRAPNETRAAWPLFPSWFVIFSSLRCSCYRSVACCASRAPSSGSPAARSMYPSLFGITSDTASPAWSSQRFSRQRCRT